MAETKNNRLKIWDDLIKTGFIVFLAVTAMLMLIAVFSSNTSQEADTGYFGTEDFNEGWMLFNGPTEKVVTLPARPDAGPGDEIYITNTLPDDITDGMSLMTRCSMSDMFIYIDDELRVEYSTDSIDGMSYYIPSAYITARLNEEDAGAQVKIVLRPKTRGMLNSVTLGYGNNAWFGVLNGEIVLNFVAMAVLLFGLMLFVTIFFLERSFKINSIRFLSLMMVDSALWVLSESRLRQLLFARPSMSQYFSYFTMELIAAFACMYFDNVMHEKYHKRYLIAETLVFSQIVINVILHFTGIMPLYQSIKFSHIWSVVCVALTIVNLITDIINKQILTYRITAIGILCFMLVSMGELLGFYINRFHQLGTCVCIALIVLMVATIMQALRDWIAIVRLHEKEHTAMTINTIETIACAIDARDEYTGGHSERVGFYAEKVAREIAEKYNLTEDDISKIRYISLVHDIGKIGVADSVLNKSGRFTEEEYELMKKHPEIGYEIMLNLGGDMGELLDGIKYHHERYDGQGYPDRLSGKNIPLVARILSLADCYDAMTSNRVYRKRLPDEEVRKEILKCSGTQFDPELADVFVSLIDRGEMEANTSEGIALDENGHVYKASVLENRLHNDIVERVGVLNPPHVRMLCYMLKLMEKQGRECTVFFFEALEYDRQERALFKDIIARFTNDHDMRIEYTDMQTIIALFDKTPEEIDGFKVAVREKCPSMRISEL